jgi:hypothetical protein
LGDSVATPVCPETCAAEPVWAAGCGATAWPEAPPVEVEAALGAAGAAA